MVKFNSEKFEIIDPVIEEQPQEKLKKIDLSQFEIIPESDNIYYLEDADKSVAVPASLNEDEANELIQTQEYNVDKRGFWGSVGVAGFNFIKGIGSMFAELPQVPGVLIQEVGEVRIKKLEKRQIEFTEKIIKNRELNAQLRKDDPDLNFFQELKSDFNILRQLKPEFVLKFDLIDVTRDLNEARAFESLGRKINQSNKAFIKKHKIIPDEGSINRVSFDLGRVGSSIFVSIGLSYALRTNLVTPILFGGIQKSQLFLEAEEKGVPIERRKALSDRGAAFEAGLEFIGLEIFTKWIRGSKTFNRIVLRSGTEGLQEVLQQASEEFIRKSEGLSQDDWETMIKRIGYAGALGFVGGVGISSIVTIAENRGVIGDLRRAGFNDAEIRQIFKGVHTSQRDIIKDQVESILTVEANKTATETIPEVEDSVDGLNTLEEQEDADSKQFIELPTVPEFVTDEEAVLFGQSADPLVVKSLENEQVVLERLRDKATSENDTQLISEIEGRMGKIDLALQQTELQRLEVKTEEFIAREDEEINLEKGEKFSEKVNRVLGLKQDFELGEEFKSTNTTFRGMSIEEFNKIQKGEETKIEKEAKGVSKAFLPEEAIENMKITLDKFGKAVLVQFKGDNPVKAFVFNKIDNNKFTFREQELQKPVVAEPRPTEAIPPQKPPVPPAEGIQEPAPGEEPRIPLEEFIKNRRGRPVTEEAIDFATGLVESAVEAIEDIGGILSTRLKNISPGLRTRMRKFEFNMLTAIRSDTSEVLDYLQSKRKIPRNDRSDLDLALKNGDVVTIERINAENGLTDSYNQVQTMLDNLYERAIETGLEVNYLENFWPRVVKDPKGLIKFMMKEEEVWTQISEAISAKETENGGQHLTEEERAYLINSLLRGFVTAQIKLGKPNALKERNIDFVTGEMNKFYANSDSSLMTYITTVNEAIEANKFFGKGSRSDRFVNVENSIGAFVLKELEAGNISAAEEELLAKLLDARFNRGRMSLAVGFYKDVNYMSILGNPINAITQLGDTAFALAKNGVYLSSKAFLKSGLGMSDITKEDIGIDRIAAEFTDTGRKTESLVRGVFKLSGLSLLDNMGKETFINSTIEKYRTQAKKNDPKLIKFLEDIFGDESNDVLKDLKSGLITENVKFLAFHELSDVQPITLSEVPVNYLKSKNGKIFYALKTFQLKLIDVYRNEVFEQMATDPVKGLQNFIRLTVAFMLVGATADFLKDLLMNRPFVLKDALVENVLKIMGFNKFTVYRTRIDGLGRTFVEQFLPPTTIVDNIYKDTEAAILIGSTLTMQDAPEFLLKSRSVQLIPLGGKLLYWWVGRGVELSDKEKTREENKADKLRFLDTMTREQRKEFLEIEKKQQQEKKLKKVLGRE